jgi:hypothetical protein
LTGKLSRNKGSRNSSNSTSNHKTYGDWKNSEDVYDTHSSLAKSVKANLEKAYLTKPSIKKVKQEEGEAKHPDQSYTPCFIGTPQMTG